MIDFVGAATDDIITSTPQDQAFGLSVVAITASSVLLTWKTPLYGVRPAGYRVVFWNFDSGQNNTGISGALSLADAVNLSSYIDVQQVCMN